MPRIFGFGKAHKPPDRSDFVEFLEYSFGNKRDKWVQQTQNLIQRESRGRFGLSGVYYHAEQNMRIMADLMQKVKMQKAL
jgi:hypothetical protein